MTSVRPYPEYMDERALCRLRDEQHAEVSQESAVELVSAAAGRCAGGAHHCVRHVLPEQLLTVVQAAKVQQLPAKPGTRTCQTTCVPALMDHIFASL